jgi:hypothetical protein
VSLPDRLLIAIVRTTHDEAEQEHLARRWQVALRRGAELEERIREQMRRGSCSCATPGALADDGRCSRCWGWLIRVGDAGAAPARGTEREEMRGG